MHLWPDHHFRLPASADASQSLELAALPNLTLLPDGLRPVDVLGCCWHQATPLFLHQGLEKPL